MSPWCNNQNTYIKFLISTQQQILSFSNHKQCRLIFERNQFKNGVQTTVDDCSFASTHPICLNHIHISICIIIHLLVNTTDGFKAENGILILA